MEKQNKNESASKVSIADLLAKNLIRINLLHNDKSSLMEFLVRDLCAATLPLDYKSLLDVLRKREEEGIATTLDTGLSLPHARIKGLAQTAAILGFPAKPFLDPKHSDYPIRAMFLFFSPDRPEAYSQQLLILRAISQLFQNDFLGELVRCSSPEQALKLIRDRETTLNKS